MTETIICYALIGDLDESRKMADRGAVQHRLRAAIERVNEAYPGLPGTPLRLTSGDEVQGISLEPGKLLNALFMLSDAVSPAQFSWGLGFGELATAVDADIAMMDGPCFHRAREALGRAKKEQTWFESAGLDSGVEEVLSALMNLMGSIRADWTLRQSEYVRARRDRSQKDIAVEFDVAASSVSRALRSARFDRIAAGERAALRLVRGLSG